MKTDDKRITSKLPVEELTGEEVARAISNRLRRRENDPELNPERRWGRELYHAGASYLKNGWVSVTYIAYQGSTKLTLAQAREYLTWLRAGNWGRHFEAERAGAMTARPNYHTWSEQRTVEYEISYIDRVWSRIELPEEDDGEWMPASDLQEGDKLYFEGKWFKLRSVTHFNPPSAEDVRATTIEMAELARQDRWDDLSKRAHQLRGDARLLAQGRMPEVHVRRLSGREFWLTPDCTVAVKR